MENDNQNELLQPKTEFSFFSPKLRTALANDSLNLILANILYRKRDNLFQIYHELWRTNREQDMYEIGKDYRVLQLARRGRVNNWFATLTCAVIAAAKEPQIVCKDFLHDFFTIIQKAQRNIPLDVELEGDDSEVVKVLTETTMENAVSMYEEHLARISREN